MGASSAAEIAHQRPHSAGVVVGGTYELLERIGQGGMAEVWRARHRSLRTEVAIKFLRGVIDESFHVRFEREAVVLAKLGRRTAHVVRVTDFATDPSPYLVMELLRGEGLHELLRRRGRLTPGEVTWVVRHLAAALEEIHAAGVVHRDLKPGNIFVHREPDGSATVKLLDFGIAKATLDDDLDAPTQEGMVLGTPQYMSPEQFLGSRAVDARADLWGLAVVAYRMLLGALPFDNGALHALAAAAPRTPTSIDPSVPPGLDAWVQRALARAPDDRFANARALYEALVEALGRPSETPVVPKREMAEPPTTLPATAASGPVAPTVVSDMPSVLPGTTRARARTRRWMGAALLLVGLGAGAGTVSAFGGRDAGDDAKTEGAAAVEPSGPSAVMPREALTIEPEPAEPDPAESERGGPDPAAPEAADPSADAEAEATPPSSETKARPSARKRRPSRRKPVDKARQSWEDLEAR